MPPTAHLLAAGLFFNWKITRGKRPKWLQYVGNCGNAGILGLSGQDPT